MSTLTAVDSILELGFRLSIWVLFLWMDTWTPFIRHIDEEEMSIYRYPSLHSYIPKLYLYGIMFGVPAVFYLIIYLSDRSLKTILDIKNQMYGLTLAYCISALFTTVIKLAVGRPRPNFFLRCFPDGYGTDIDSCTGEYEGQMDGRKSFPSAHASFSFTGMVFITLYIFKRVDFSKPYFCKGILFFLSTFPVLIATMISISRTCDYHHHYSDVLGGAVMGTFIAALVFYYYQDSAEEVDKEDLKAR